jgi:hypothetical protein
MLMRYHWGCAVGHIYAHQRKHLVRDGEPEQDCPGEYNEECADDHDDGSAHDQRECDGESGQSDSDSFSDDFDYSDPSDSHSDMEH